MFFVIISISTYFFGIYLFLVLSNFNAIQSTDCHVRYFNKLSIYLSCVICVVIAREIFLLQSDCPEITKVHNKFENNNKTEILPLNVVDD